MAEIERRHRRLGLRYLAGASDSVLTSIDTDAEAQSYARENFTMAGVRSGRFRLINGRSADMLPRLASASYDLVLVDADPAEAAGDVYEALRMLRPGGTLVVAHARSITTGWQTQPAATTPRSPHHPTAGNSLRLKT